MPKMTAADWLRAAIDYALDHADDGLVWLRAWNEGDREAMAELEAHVQATFDSN